MLCCIIGVGELAIHKIGKPCLQRFYTLGEEIATHIEKYL
jgi:hypothetical protein